MAHSGLTNQIRESVKQRSSRGGATIDTFQIHHQAGTNDDATINAMVSASKQVSANYTISNEGRLTLVVNEDYRAWTSSSPFWDSRSITVEIENESGSPDWRISEAAIETAARLYNDLKSRYPIKQVYGHRDLHNLFGDSYATYCPGPNTVNRIVAKAAEFAGGAIVVPAVVAKPVAVVSHSNVGWIYWEPNGTGVARRVQQALKNRGRYDGLVDDVFGPKTRAGIQKTLNISGEFKGKEDGVIEGGGCRGIQTYAAKYGDYTGPIDSQLGINSWIGFALGLERP